MKPDYDTTLARIAGNIAGILEAEAPFGSSFENRVAARAVAIARAIAAEVKRTTVAEPSQADLNILDRLIAQEADAIAGLFVELAWLVPPGTDLRKHPVGQKLTACLDLVRRVAVLQQSVR